MPQIEVSEEQILEALARLSTRARQRALRALLKGTEDLDRLVERNQARMEAIAKDRGLDWDRLSEEQREALVDDLLHDRPPAP